MFCTANMSAQCGRGCEPDRIIPRLSQAVVIIRLADSCELTAVFPMRFELFIATRYLRAKRRQVEAFCGRERSGSPQPKSRAKRGTSR
jgi:hypothetical protein